ncbi:MAG: hypothetical protein ACYCW5_04960 [Thermoleophilia bacterium]
MDASSLFYNTKNFADDKLTSPLIHSKKMKTYKFILAVYAVLFAGAIAAYYSILNNTYIGDDYSLTGKTELASFPDFRPLFTINKVSMRPLAFLVLWLQDRIFGIEALVPSHLLTVGIHAAVACLLFSLLLGMKAHRITALLVAVLFLLTPVAPEAVTWSVVRFDAMVIFFMLLTLLLYINYLKRRDSRIYIGALFASTAAIFSKESAILLLVLIPALDLLFKDSLTSAGAVPNETGLISSIKGTARRLFPFLVPITIFFNIRYFTIGKVFGSYPNVPTIGAPNLQATMHSFATLLSPLNNAIFGARAIQTSAMISLSLLVTSLFVVVIRWGRCRGTARRIWLFFVFFFLVSIAPVFSAFFMMGLNHSLEESRYLYIPMMSLTAVTVIGLLEFGWDRPVWRVPVIAALAICVPLSFYCLNENNKAWERAALISYDIPRQTQNILPDPPSGSRLYFAGVPEWSGAYIYVNGLNYAVQWQYGRSDFSVTKLKPGIEIPSSGDNIFLFTYDEESGHLSFTKLR